MLTSWGCSYCICNCISLVSDFYIFWPFIFQIIFKEFVLINPLSSSAPILLMLCFPGIYFIFFMFAKEFQQISSRVESRKCTFHGAQDSLLQFRKDVWQCIFFIQKQKWNAASFLKHTLFTLACSYFTGLCQPHYIGDLRTQLERFNEVL